MMPCPFCSSCLAYTIHNKCVLVETTSLEILPGRGTTPTGTWTTVVSYSIGDFVLTVRWLRGFWLITGIFDCSCGWKIVTGRYRR